MVTMQARTLAYRLMVLGPLIYIGGIAVQARVHIDVFSFVACTPKQHNSMLAYREPCLLAGGLRSSTPRNVDVARLRTVAEVWIQQAEAGKLVALTPVDLNDFVRDGIKQEIYRTNHQMVFLLTEVGHAELKRGDAKAASEDLVRAIRLAETLKYSDPYSIYQMGALQRNALAKLEGATPHLDAKSKVWVRSSLRRIRDRQQSLEPVVRLIYRLYREARIDARPGKGLSSIATFLGQAKEADSKSVSVLASLPRPNGDEDSMETGLVGILRMSGLSQAHWLRQIDAQISAMNSISVVEDPKSTRVAVVAP